MRLNEAIHYSVEMGNTDCAKNLKKALWPDSAVNVQNINLARLRSGKTKTIKPEWIKIISDETGVTPECLLGID